MMIIDVGSMKEVINWLIEGGNYIAFCPQGIGKGVMYTI